MTNEKVLKIKTQMEARLKLYEEKNERYGDAFSLTFEKYGPISALTRMEDKMNRLRTLVLNPNLDPKDESIIDTLNDLANYCDMTIEAMTRDSSKKSVKKKPRKKPNTESSKKEKTK